jgi:hypothetical protein
VPDFSATLIAALGKQKRTMKQAIEPQEFAAKAHTCCWATIQEFMK